MPIRKPGEKFRHSALLRRRGSARGVTAILSLTAMVDMFTVIVIFLLQNYNSTGQVIYIPKEVILPKASATKELKPSHVVTVSPKEVLIEAEVVGRYQDIVNQKEWLVPNLFNGLKKRIARAKIESERNLRQQIKKATGKDKEDGNSWRKVTIQADKQIDFITLKKIMYTVTEAGAAEINFAVLSEASKK